LKAEKYRGLSRLPYFSTKHTYHRSTMRLPSPGFLLAALLQVCRRFPGTMLCAILGTFSCIALMERVGHDSEKDALIRLWMSAQLGLPLLTALTVYSESSNWDEKRRWLSQLLGLVGLAGCWLWLDPKADSFDYLRLPQYLALLLVAHLAVAVAPYLNARSVRDFWEYNRRLFAHFVVGASFTLILYVGLALAILAVDNLFNARINERIYAHLFVLLAGIFNTVYFLHQFPSAYAFEREEGGAYNAVFRNLCKFILLPIVALYFFILYAYGAKIGLEWSLPKGWVGSLVLGFSVAGIFSYLLNFYLPEEDKSLIVNAFKRWFWWVLLPLTGLLFVAIGKRIGDYGVTEARFLVAQLGVWLAATCLYFLISKRDNLKFIPISLALFALVWAFGPLSAHAVAERSQRGILTRILEQTGRLENGKMKPGTVPLTDLESQRALSALYFLENRNALADLAPLPIDSLRQKFGGISAWLGLDASSSPTRISLNISAEMDDNTLDVRGFHTLYRADLNVRSDSSYNGPDTYLFALSEDRKRLEWRAAQAAKITLVESFDLQPAFQKWFENVEKNENYTYRSLPLPDRTLHFAGRRGTLRLIVEDARIVKTNDSLSADYLSGKILLRDNSK
jgi:hypothetical protein